jgi:hypothetical protein
VEIPYEDAVLHGYFYRTAGEGPKPTLVMHNGFDGAAECTSSAPSADRNAATTS